MKQSDLVKSIAAACGETHATVEAVLQAQSQVASKALGEGDDVTIPGLIKLTPKARAERMGRNPKTGEAIKIAAKTVVTGKPLKALADHVA